MKVGFYLPNEPIKSFPDTLRHEGNGQYSLETELPAQILFLFDPAQQVVTPYNLRDAEFIVGLQFDGIFRLGTCLELRQSEPWLTVRWGAEEDY